MEKIVILSNAGKERSPLAKSLQMLFPESKVQVVANKKSTPKNLTEVKKHKDEKDKYILREKAYGL